MELGVFCALLYLLLFDFGAAYTKVHVKQDCDNCIGDAALPKQDALQVQHETYIPPKGCPERCPHCPKRPNCPRGVKIVQDPCRCCLDCVRQEGEDCDALHACDSGLICVNKTCHSVHAADCKVGSRTYRDGDKWKPNCQTVCECQNGIYGCTDVCQPDENPSDCQFGRQFVVESQCCSRWVCKNSPSVCSNTTTEWTECSCSNPVSYQWTNANPACQWTVQQRSCPTENCQQGTTPRIVPKTKYLEAEHSCSSSMYERYEYLVQDNCKSTRLVLQKTCATECHVIDGTRLCCLPDEYVSFPVKLRCPDRKNVLRSIPMVVACKCSLC